MAPPKSPTARATSLGLSPPLPCAVNAVSCKAAFSHHQPGQQPVASAGAVGTLQELPHLLQRLKGGSATLADREHHSPTPLRWARGYTIESVSRRTLPAARAYVRCQERRHPEDVIEGWVVPESVSSEREEESMGEDRRSTRPRRVR